ncbi:sodium:proton antiporter [Gracilibacillus oryzae]|uniref:Sodium:proton antiporter n=1 Tax=Gracilibacillus oryzae TaxID=1672701 RepID=A0A7C8GRT0_9BACI|nr:sodium:proton antiporter [Gracilibacillus oryzae]KAB8128436.1 sodium:proton antiporter [Gracilibacillus oryzae]
MRLFRTLLTIFALAGVIYRFRMKVINFIASVPFLRKISVRFAMQIPFIRKKFMQSMFLKQ